MGREKQRAREREKREREREREMAPREPPKWVKKSNKWFKKKAQKAREAFANIGGKGRSGDDDDDLDDTDYQPIASTRNEGEKQVTFGATPSFRRLKSQRSNKWDPDILAAWGGNPVVFSNEDLLGGDSGVYNIRVETVTSLVSPSEAYANLETPTGESEPLTGRTWRSETGRSWRSEEGKKILLKVSSSGNRK